MPTKLWLMVIGFWCLASVSWAANSVYQISRSVVNSAGSTRTASGKILHDSLGETLVEQSSTAMYSIQSGFFSESLQAGTTPTAVPTATMVVPNTYLKIFHNQINPNRGEQAIVRWTQPQTAAVTITVYNMVGDKIVTLVDHQTYGAQAFQEVRWDGRNSKGEAVGSGIYIVHLKTDGFDTYYKVAVIK